MWGYGILRVLVWPGLSCEAVGGYEQDRCVNYHVNKLSNGHTRLSTVLAQDHFYSDFLSLQVTHQKPFVTVMLMGSCLATGKYVSGFPLQM